METLYCYIVKGTEVAIVGVWRDKDEALQEAKDHAKDQGVKTFEVTEINDDYIVIDPVEYDTFEKVEIVRYILH